VGEGSSKPYAFLDDFPFAEKPIDANLHLLLKTPNLVVGEVRTW
jgi:hypothetical protein